jgi:para-nitrobenzyl esterase
MAKGEAPILDGQLVTENTMEAFAAGHEARIPYLIGSNSLEVPRPPPPGAEDILRLSPAQTTALEDAYGYAGGYPRHVMTDVIFGAPARALARAHAATGAPTYLYRFSVTSPFVTKTYGGAIHASDRQYVFRTLNASPWPTDANDEAQARTISAYWVAFAKTGNPNGADRPAWPAYGGSDQLLAFTNSGPAATATPDRQVLDVISGR